MTIPTGFGQATVVVTGGGIENEANWTFGFDNNTASEPAAIAESLADLLVGADYLDNLSSSCTFAAVRVKLGPDASGPSGEHSVGSVGTIGGNAAPPNVAVLGSKSTPLGGRHGRGRFYWPGVAEASLLSNGTVEGALVTGYQVMIDDVLSAMNFVSLPMMLLHADETSPTAITSVAVQTRFATQRRRLRR